VTLHEMSAETRVGSECALKVNQTVGTKCADIGARHGFAKEIEGDLLLAVRRNRQAAAVDGDAVADANAGGDLRRRDLQLSPAFRGADPKDGADLFDEAGEHDS